jgi:hypothetical protein
MTPEQQLESFIARFTPEIAAQTREALEWMRKRLPGAVELAYDNYNALAIGFAPNERTSDAIFSIAVYPRWVSLFFLHGATLPDPDGVLKGGGNVVRYVVLEGIATLESPPIKKLMLLALRNSGQKIDKKQPGRLVIKSISPKQRPRRPK